ncbi:TetR/AcrR family transcriptional regulator [Streptomyces sp. B3I8]|uniref:TetR/AcrR family transcriptional regulator n=1 Tax=Streptomyces sp. B3I8 TaxID=3042303 RepID=UPI002785FE6D|nr:TetR/AcrR family transcriptional regulator [Streptomyces sp. B3I8]MDQ0790427.1 AcrR family transcriptional regulator [Streptomyces sp. B3I8]
MPPAHPSPRSGPHGECAARASRSDARENRARLVASARAALLADPAASLASIARAAGVGQGTLYRHFSGREELLLAVHEAEVAALVEAVPELLSRHEPLVALRQWLERLADGGGRYGRCHPPVVAALDRLLAAGRDAGQVRAEATAEEVLLLGSVLWETGGGGGPADDPGGGSGGGDGAGRGGGRDRGGVGAGAGSGAGAGVGVGAGAGVGAVRLERSEFLERRGRMLGMLVDGLRDAGPGGRDG